MKKEPAWRAHFARPQALHEPYGQMKISVPSYLRRWMNVHGNKPPEIMAAEILEAAMQMYFQSLAAPARYVDDLLCGKYVDGNEVALCREIVDDNLPFETICVSNGAYGYFFCCRWPLEEFRAWVANEWTARQVTIDGPVLRLEKGEWPIQPRLIPGHPLGKKLEF